LAGMIVQHNLNAINANNRLNVNVLGTKKAAEKLSSGYRINRAADDAAGLAISEKMRALIRALGANINNIDVGTDMLNVADAAMDSMHAITQRMNELALQSTNATYSDEERGYINQEYKQLKEELDRIVLSTEFNGIKVFEGRENIVKVAVPDKTFSTIDFGESHYVFKGYNDELYFNYNGSKHSITIDEGTYSKEQLVDLINLKFEQQHVNVTVSIDDLTGSLVYDAHGGVFDSFSGNMMSDNNPPNSIISNIIKKGYSIDGKYGEIRGASNIPETVEITEDDNPLAFDLQAAGGSPITVKIEFASGDYSRDDIVGTINKYFTDNSLTAKAEIQNGKLVISRTINGIGNGFSSTIPSTGLNDMFLRSVTTSINRSVNQDVGRTFYKPDPGIKVTKPYQDNSWYTNNPPTQEPKIGDPKTVAGNSTTVKETRPVATQGEAAKFTSGTIIRNVHSADDFGLYRGSFSFTYGSTTISVDFGNGKVFNSKTLVTEINSQISDSGISCSLDANGRLAFSGAGGNFTDNFTIISNNVVIISGTSDQGVSHTLTFSAATPAVSAGMIWQYRVNDYDITVIEPTPGYVPEVTGRQAAYFERRTPTSGYSFQNPIVIDSTNCELLINVTSPSGSIPQICVNIPLGSYSDAQMQSVISSQLPSEYLTLSNDGSFRLETKEEGAGWSIDVVQNGAFDAIYGKTGKFTTNPSIINPTNVVSDNAVAYGRIDLTANPITNIIKGKNDVLEFDITVNGIKTRYSGVIPEGKYNSEELIDAMNIAISESGAKGVRAELSHEQESGVDGSIISTKLVYTPNPGENATLDGVGGSAAYSVFYRGLLEDYVIPPHKLVLQVGPNGSPLETNVFVTDVPIELSLKRMKLAESEVTTFDSALKAIDEVGEAINLINVRRATSGAHINALEHLRDNIVVKSENTTASESQIRDTDIATMIVEYTKHMILQQTAQAMLAQANQSPQSVLQLLQ